MPASSDESGANEDLKAKMREALDRKKQGGAKGKGGDNPVPREGPRLRGRRRICPQDAPPQGRWWRLLMRGVRSRRQVRALRLASVTSGRRPPPVLELNRAASVRHHWSRQVIHAWSRAGS